VVQQVLELRPVLADGEQPLGKIEVGEVDLVLATDFEGLGREVFLQLGLGLKRRRRCLRSAAPRRKLKPGGQSWRIRGR
jgi:hypothetical protein